MKKRTLTAVLALIFALLLLPSTATAGNVMGEAYFYDVPGHRVEVLYIQFDPVTTPDGETVYIFEFELTTKDDGNGVPVPSRPGYIFLGWKSETDGKIIITATLLPSQGARTISMLSGQTYRI